MILKIDTTSGAENLSEWAERGVLLLNTVLTVRAHNANSHQKKGWENFTDAVIQSIGSREQHHGFHSMGQTSRKEKRP